MKQKGLKKIFLIGVITLMALATGLLTVQFSAPPVSPPLSPYKPEPSTSEITPASPAPSHQARNIVSKKQSEATSGLLTTSSPSSYRGKITEEGRVLSINGKRYPIRTYETLATPNDPLASQWWVGSTGLSAAWDYGAGGYKPLIAVIDTGFALQHEEFTDRWHANTGEKGPVSSENPSALNCTDRQLPLAADCNNIDDDFNGVVDDEIGPTTIQNPSWLNCSDQAISLDKSCNRLDDDGNGLIDDARGWDFSNFDHSVQAGEVNPAGSNTTHGTMVAGILGATGNNGKGIAGVNWSATILPLQAIDDDGYGDTWTVARSIRYAADQKADIISLSLGASLEDPYMREAVGYAIGKGSLVVAASGNDGCDCILYPARYSEVLAIGASYNGSPAAFSSYGSQLDLLAPGQDMTAPTWSAANQSTAYASGIAGTSFATPYISGLLGLAKSHLPQASWGELVAALQEQSDHRTSTLQSPHSATYGYGYVMADKLLSRVRTAASPQQQYVFGVLKPENTLDTTRAQSCESGGFSTTPIHQLIRGSEIRHTASPLTAYQYVQAGWATKQIAYSCVGLPHDSPIKIRIINLLSELFNSGNMKPL